MYGSGNGTDRFHQLNMKMEVCLVFPFLQQTNSLSFIQIQIERIPAIKDIEIIFGIEDILVKHPFASSFVCPNLTAVHPLREVNLHLPYAPGLSRTQLSSSGQCNPFPRPSNQQEIE